MPSASSVCNRRAMFSAASPKSYGVTSGWPSGKVPSSTPPTEKLRVSPTVYTNMPSASVVPGFALPDW